MVESDFTGSGIVSAAYKLDIKGFNDGVSKVLTLRPLTDAVGEVSKRAASALTGSHHGRDEKKQDRKASSQVNGVVVKRK